MFPRGAYLITGGRYVINYGLLFGETLAPGSYLVATEGRLPLGTPAGTYRFDVSPASQVLLEDGTVVAPIAVGDGGITVEREVGQGWDEGLPPLALDAENRKVLGPVAFRFVDEIPRPSRSIGSTRV